MRHKLTTRALIPPWLRRGIKALLREASLEESAIVLEAFGQLRGTMIDVGAHHGSSLEGFARRGWRVHAFEPDPANMRILAKAVRNLPSVTLDDRAVSDQSVTDLPFYTSRQSSGLSGLLPFHPSHERHGTVRTTTLREFCTEIDLAAIDFLKIDTEGLDLPVLKGLGWQSMKPRVILCEFEDRKTLKLGYTYHDLAGYLAGHGYHLLLSEWHPIVRYGARHQWRRFAEYPCNLASPDAWGNIFAVHELSMYQTLVAAATRHGSQFRY